MEFHLGEWGKITCRATSLGQNQLRGESDYSLEPAYQLQGEQQWEKSAVSMPFLCGFPGVSGLPMGDTGLAGLPLICSSSSSLCASHKTHWQVVPSLVFWKRRSGPEWNLGGGGG